MGRPPGAKNLKTEEWDIFRNYCMEGGLKRFRKELDKLEGKDYTSTFINLIEFHKPKRARIENSLDQETKDLLISWMNANKSGDTIPTSTSSVRVSQ